MKLTEWFDSDVKPSIVGVYEVKSAYGFSGPYYSYWDGIRFGWRCYKTPQSAFENRNEYTEAPATAIWRGLAEDANRSKP